jgi:hypothetical protein
MTVEHGLHDSPLHASSPAVYEADFLEPCPGSGGYVLFDHRRDVPRGEGMKIQFIADGNLMHRENFRIQISDFRLPTICNLQSEISNFMPVNMRQSRPF